MTEFKFWKVEYPYGDGCHRHQRTMRFLTRYNAIEKAKELVVKVEYQLNSDIIKAVDKACRPDITDGLLQIVIKFGEPSVFALKEEEFDGVEVVARRSVSVITTRPEKILIKKEVKEEGKPYCAPQYEERKNENELGILFISRGGNRYEETKAGFGEEPKERYRTYEQYIHEEKVLVYRETIKTED